MLQTIIISIQINRAIFYRKVLFIYPNVDITEPLWPVFGTYNPYSVHVELTLRTGRDIMLIPDVLRPVCILCLVVMLGQ